MDCLQLPQERFYKTAGQLQFLTSNRKLERKVLSRSLNRQSSLWVCLIGNQKNDTTVVGLSFHSHFEWFSMSAPSPLHLEGHRLVRFRGLAKFQKIREVATCEEAHQGFRASRELGGLVDFVDTLQAPFATKFIFPVGILYAIHSCRMGFHIGHDLCRRS